jgi:hypothetical protein
MQRAGAAALWVLELLQQCLLSVCALLVQHVDWLQAWVSNSGAQTCGAHAMFDMPEV